METTKKTKTTFIKKPKPKFAKPNTLVKIYALYKSDDVKHTRPITFTSDHIDMLAAIDQYIYFEKFHHFKLWREYHHLPLDHGTSWEEYNRVVLSSESEELNAMFVVVEYWYSHAEIASILRMFTLCTPLAMPYETEDEVKFYSDNTDGKPNTPIEDAMEEAAIAFQQLHPEDFPDNDALPKT